MEIKTIAQLYFFSYSGEIQRREASRAQPEADVTFKLLYALDYITVIEQILKINQKQFSKSDYKNLCRLCRWP